MSTLQIAGDTSGSVTLSIPAVAGTSVISLPAATGTAVLDNTTQTLTNKTLTSPVITGANVSSMASSVITLGTAQTPTTATSIDFTGIPSWTKRIVISMYGLTYNGATSDTIFRLGAGSIETTGYAGGTNRISQAIAGGGFFTGTDGLYLGYGLPGVIAISGHVILTNISGNLWVSSGTSVALSGGGTYNLLYAGNKTVGGTLDRIRLTTVLGTVAFTAGTINITYE